LSSPSTAPRSSAPGAARWTNAAVRPAGARPGRAPAIAMISSADRGRRRRRTAWNRR
jgi:hypothetical protein